MSMPEKPVPGILFLEAHGGKPAREFPGFLFGAPLPARPRPEDRDKGYGEVVFNTSMTGYQEILTDPSYYGQMVCMTVPHVGNVGINSADPESVRPWCAGFIVHEACAEPSNWRAQGSLHEYLLKNGVPGIFGVDTRALTQHLRSMGVVRGLILPASERAQAPARLKELPPFEGRDLIGEVTTREPYSWKEATPQGDAPQSSAIASAGPARSREFKVVAVDFGVKRNLLRSLSHFGCDVTVVPAHASAQEILAHRPDGVFLSNGPGDPSAAPYAAKSVGELVGQVPIFGVCMGHQILALSLGAKTFKMKFGHRGGNQPVLDQKTQRVEISSHNHGYAVDPGTLPKNVEVTHKNLNDGTVEGLRVVLGNGAPEAFSVQYHPEACPGPHDSMALFERFVENMRSRQR